MSIKNAAIIGRPLYLLPTIIWDTRSNQYGSSTPVASDTLRNKWTFDVSGSNLTVVFGNIYQPSGGGAESATEADITLHAAIEVYDPGNGSQSDFESGNIRGSLHELTFNSSSTIVLSALDHWQSDVISGITATAGEVYYIVVYVSSAGGSYPTNSIGQGFFQCLGTGTGNDHVLDAAATFSLQNGNPYAFTHLGVFGTQAATKKYVVAVGDSIGAGAVDTG
jgi:hypothetical protein